MTDTVDKIQRSFQSEKARKKVILGKKLKVNPNITAILPDFVVHKYKQIFKKDQEELLNMGLKNLALQ